MVQNNPRVIATPNWINLRVTHIDLIFLSPELRLSMGISDEIEVAMIPINKTRISEIEATIYKLLENI